MLRFIIHQSGGYYPPPLFSKLGLLHITNSKKPLKIAGNVNANVCIKFIIVFLFIVIAKKPKLFTGCIFANQSSSEAIY